MINYITHEITLSGSHDDIFVFVNAPENTSEAELEQIAIDEVTQNTEIASSSFNNSCYNVVLSGDHPDIFVLVPGHQTMNRDELLKHAIKEAFSNSYIN